MKSRVEWFRSFFEETEIAKAEKMDAKFNVRHIKKVFFYFCITLLGVFSLKCFKNPTRVPKDAEF
jgi:hypothetical protein